MKVLLLLFLTLFAKDIYARFGLKSNSDTIILVIDKNTKKAIDKYDNFFYLFPYVIVFDTQNLTGKELINKNTLTNTLTKVAIDSKDENYILQCKTLKQEIEVILRKGDRTNITINGDETKIKVLNRITELYELSIDELLQKKNQDPNLAIKKYLNPLHYLTYDDAMSKGHIKEIELKKKAFKDILLFTKAAINTMDSLQSNGLISTITANFNRNKLKNQLLSINILESKIDYDSAKTIIKKDSNLLFPYPDKYQYKLIERFVDKFFVQTAKEIKFNDIINRDYCEIYDKINESALFKSNYKNLLLERELDRIIHSFPKSIGEKYYKLFLKTVTDSLLAETVKSKYYSIFTPTINQKELISIQNINNSFSNIASRNKFTYVDFWASWCGPCRSEMPNSKKLEAIYEKKGINFIYISTDENLNSWQKASKQIGLKESNSYLLLKDSALAKKFKISSIPRYMIIDKNGEFVNQDALRPSDPNLIKIFEDLLKGK